MSEALNRVVARWRIGLRLARRDARRHLGRTALVAVMVAVPVLAGTTAFTALESSKDSPETVRDESLGPDLQASLDYLGAGRVLQTFDATNATWGLDAESDEPPTRAEHEKVLAEALPPGDRLVPVETAQVVLHGPGPQLTSKMAQTDLRDADVAAAFKLRAGIAPGPGEIAISREVAAQIGVDVGDTVVVEMRDSGSTETLTVSGLLGRHLPKDSGAVVHTAPEDVSPSLVDVAGWGEVGWFVSGPTPVTWDDALRLNEHGVAVISQEVLTHLPPPEAETFDHPYEALDANEVALGGAITIIALLEGILIVGPAFAVSARRQERSLAVAAAQGASPRALRALAMIPAIAVGLGASVIAALAGVAVATVPLRYFEFTVVVVPWPRVGAMVLLGAVVAVAAAWLPARAAARLDVVATLTGRRRQHRVKGWSVVLGVILAGAGLTGAVAAATAGDGGVLLAWCVVVAEIGLVLTTGGIVAGLARLSGRLPLPARFALRDAARHRQRTSPAVAAVLVAVAGATAGLVFVTSEARYQERAYLPASTPGTTIVYANTALDLAELRPEIESTVRDVLPDVTAVTPVPVLTETSDGWPTTVIVTTEADRSWPGGGEPAGPVVDDGNLVPLLGLTGTAADTAVTALRDGRAVVPHGSTDADGTARLRIQAHTLTGQGVAFAPPRERTVRVPATEVGDGTEVVPNLPLVPPALLDTLAGEPRVGRFVVETDTIPTAAQTQALSHRLGDIAIPPGVDPFADGTGSDDDSRTHLSARTELGYEPGADAIGAPVIALLAVLVALVVTWLAAGLAAVESRPDLATLDAVGAAPRTRRKIVAAHAGAISVVGTVLGLGAGGVLGAALVQLQRPWVPADIPGAWAVEVPWLWLLGLAVTLPVLAIASAWLAARPRRLLARRLG
ncbi:FtsX-like permease family protein [Promicromonospora sp. MEB111]|uniref:FtsX-like permease family protein n=1 Tax=Promicromonospora sp. MEB111 TaxID=3040301 RepID=UPI00254B3538|nr:FtsX-like permease family protein [Promicromonospora sp. MEB111]